MNIQRSLMSLSLLALGLTLSIPASFARDFRFDPNFATMQAQTTANLNTQRAQIEARISTAQSAGQITAAQAADFRAQLAQNGSLQNQYLADGIITVPEVQTLQTSMMGVDSSVQSAISANANTTFNFASSVSQNPYAAHSCAAPASFTPTNPPHGNAWGWGHKWNRSRISDSQLDALQTNISTGLERGRIDRRLTYNEYRSLKSELDRIISRRTRMNTGGLDFNERHSLYDKLSNLSMRLNKELNDQDIARRFGNRWY